LPIDRTPKSPDTQLVQAKARLFSSRWLAEPDADGKFPTNGDDFAAQELSKRQDVNGFTRKGFLLQAIAVGWHHKSAQQLKALADAVGRERIQVVHGSVDKLITVMHGQTLARELGNEKQNVTYVEIEGCGHVTPFEARKELAKIVTEFVAKNS
jgi:pimeloyl-ACP methyl ester carboxylesterase